MDNTKFLTFFSALLVLTTAHYVEVNIQVPQYEVPGNDAYLCAATKLPATPYKLVGVIPNAVQEVVHHILLYGCEKPHTEPQGNGTSVWDCNHSSICQGGNSGIIYGWGRNASSMTMPEGVGYSVGGGSAIAYVVAQVHYLGARPPGEHSGVTLMLKPHAVPYSAGLLSFATSFTIPPGQKAHNITASCCYDGFEPVTMFASRVHTHKLGRRVILERPDPSQLGKPQVLHEKDPQLPQAFYPTPYTLMHPGDRLTATCTFDSSSMKMPTFAGPTHDHEMCNLYAMLFGTMPYMGMCSGGTPSSDRHSPGQLPKSGQWILDPTPSWAPPQPSSSPLGHVASVALGLNGTIWALHRGSHVWTAATFDGANRVRSKDLITQDVVVVLDPDTGHVIRSFGRNLFSMPHTITPDADGGVWVVDCGLHQVLKFDARGQLVLALGEQWVPGTTGGQLCKPTQAVTARDGTIFVSSGYCDNRIVIFSPKGTYQGEIRLPAALVVHSLLLDECRGEILVASRENGQVHRIHYKGQPGDMKGTIAANIEVVNLSNLGRVWALRRAPHGAMLAMTWEMNKAAMLVDVHSPRQTWVLPGLEQRFPHDFALAAAPTWLTGAGDRFFATYVAPTCQPGCGPLTKFVLLPPGFHVPNLPAAVPHVDVSVAGGSGAEHAQADKSHEHGTDDMHSSSVAASTASTAHTHAGESHAVPSDAHAQTEGTGTESSTGTAATGGMGVTVAGQKERGNAWAMGKGQGRAHDREHGSLNVVVHDEQQKSAAVAAGSGAGALGLQSSGGADGKVGVGSEQQKSAAEYKKVQSEKLGSGGRPVATVSLAEESNEVTKTAVPVTDSKTTVASAVVPVAPSSGAETSLPVGIVNVGGVDGHGSGWQVRLGLLVAGVVGSAALVAVAAVMVVQLLSAQKRLRQQAEAGMKPHHKRATIDDMLALGEVLEEVPAERKDILDL